MVTRDENEMVTQVGPGTPTGDLMREYRLWKLGGRSWMETMAAKLQQPSGDKEWHISAGNSRRGS